MLATQLPTDTFQDVYLFFLPSSLPTTLLYSLLTQMNWKREALQWGKEDIQDADLKWGEGSRQVKNEMPFHISLTFSSTFPVLPHSIVK